MGKIFLCLLCCLIYVQTSQPWKKIAVQQIFSCKESVPCIFVRMRPVLILEHVRLKIRGGNSETGKEEILDTMPTFTPQPRLVGTKDCPDEDIPTIFKVKAMKKDIMVCEKHVFRIHLNFC